MFKLTRRDQQTNEIERAHEEHRRVAEKAVRSALGSTLMADDAYHALEELMANMEKKRNGKDHRVAS